MTAQKKKAFTSEERLIAVKRVLGGESATSVSRDLVVARKTLYVWIKKYRSARGRAREVSLSNSYCKRKSHPRFYRETFRYRLLSLVVTYPAWSITKYAKKLSIGRHAAYSLLKELDLTTEDGRIAFGNLYNGPGRLETDIKRSIVNAVLRSDISVTEASREHSVSRKTIYKWINRYKNNESGDTNYCRGDKHYKSFSDKAVREILDAVKANPNLSIHSLSQRLPYSSHGIFNVLKAHNLTYKDARVAFAKRDSFVSSYTFQDNARKKITADGFVPNHAPAPPPLFLSLLKTISASFIATIALALVGRYWIDLIVSAPSLSYGIGILFATVSLLMGSLFFLYSFKYYITLALVLSYSQSGEDESDSSRGTLLQRILGQKELEKDSQGYLGNGKVAGLESNLDHITLERHPYVSVQIPFYNEKYVAERAIVAATNFDYKGDYEVVVCDDSTDQTTEIIQRYIKKNAKKVSRIENKKDGWTLTSGEVRPGVTLKHLHRTSRSGFKGAALKLALTLVDDRTEFISVFDADFVPYPDSLELFLKYFKVQNKGSEDYTGSKVAAVQGYQWHVLNKSENWITRGVRSEYSGSYVIERAGQEIYGGLKHISGSVYMIRREPLEEVGWKSSITEDYELTLRLYDAGYKVVYTPYIQAPAECVSTLKRLIRQRMRWAEGHSFNVKIMWKRLLFGRWIERAEIPHQVHSSHLAKSLRDDKVDFDSLSTLSNVTGQKSRVFIPSPLTGAEKIEFLFNIPYYLQAFFFLVGTLSWLVSEAIFPARLPFWTTLWGWSLVLTNMFALPLVNAIGLFLEEGEEKDYAGLGSFVLLSYIVVPFQAYAAMKGFLEKEEGGWFRTPKTGVITDVFKRGTFYRLIERILPSRLTEARSQRTSLPSNMSQYMSFSSANNRFDNFSIKPTSKRRLLFGRVVVGIFALMFVGVNYMSTFVQHKEITVRPPTSHLVISQKTDYALTENPEFIVVMPQSPKKQGSLVKEVHADEQVELETKVYYGGQEIDVPIEKEKMIDGNYKVTLVPSNSLKPGKYSLVTSLGGLSGTGLNSQDFTWGVLAMNFNKASYIYGDVVEIGIGVVDDNGNTICDADIEVEIQGEEYSDFYSTGNGRIYYSENCGATTVTNEPDYSLSVPSLSIGEYEVTVKANIENGERGVTENFNVYESLEFDVERDSATRIFPPAKYEMNISITPDTSFEGTVNERVPSSFEVTGDFDIETQETTKVLSWDVQWEKGETYTLSYSYKAPDIAPEFYLLGPLEFVTSLGETVYTEARSWQIAADAVAHDATTDGGETTSFSHTVSGSDRLLLVFVSMFQTTDPDVSSITYNGVSLSKVAEATNNWTVNRFGETQVWSLANPTTGSNTVSVTLAGSPTAYSVVATSYTGVDTTDPIGATSTNTGNSSNPSVVITTQDANSLIVGGGSMLGGDTDPYTPGTGTTERWDSATGTSQFFDIGYFGGDEATTTAGNYTFDFTSSAGDQWNIAAVEVVVPEKLLLFILLVPFLPYYLKRKHN